MVDRTSQEPKVPQSSSNSQQQSEKTQPVTKEFKADSEIEKGPSKQDKTETPEREVPDVQAGQSRRDH